MTRDFYHQFRETCEAEGIPYVIAMRAGEDGGWVAAFELKNHAPCKERSKEEDILAMLRTVLTGVDEADQC